MTVESDRDFNVRRAIDERALADMATDKVRSIPHRQLAKLHAEAARGAAGSLATRTAVPIADRLLFGAGDAQRQKHPV